MNKNRIIPFFIFTILLLSSGCGYTTRSLITQEYQDIYVRPFVNKIDITSRTSVAKQYKTYYPLLEKDITSKVIDQFILDGNLKIAGQDEADLILEGELLDYRKDALRYTGADNEDIEEYRINLVVNIRLKETDTNTLLWEVNNFIGDTTYFPQQKSESAAIDAAIEDLARRIVDRVVDVW